MMRRVVLLVTFLLVCAGSASAQSGSDGWNVAIYPVFGWIPLDIDIKVDVPPFDNGTGGGSGGGWLRQLPHFGGGSGRVAADGAAQPAQALSHT